MSLSIKRSRRRKMSSIAGLTSHAISPPAPDTTRASRALAVTACQCGLSDRSRRPRTRCRELTRGGGAARGDESSSTPFDATLAKPVRLFKLRSWAAATAWYSAASEALSMCGIAGVLLRRGSPDEGALRRMGDALAHRGPDDLGVHVAGPLGLLQTRLSIIDLEGGHQPMADGPLTLVANGEIYNYVELRQALEARGRRFATHSDSETILHAYALDGLGALPSLNGMFAFALYDAGRRELVLGRGALGIKPHYYAELPDRVLFASELKAILSVWPGEPALDPGALVQYLQNRFNTGEQSLVQGIRRLPPGTTLVVDADLKLQERPYWSLLDIRTRRLEFGQADAEFEPLFHQVMLGHLRADVPWGLFLSSGVDSGVLLATMSELTGRPVRTFSIGYHDGAAADDELPDAAAIARRFGAEHTEIVLDRDAVFRRLPHTIWATDDLLHDYACLPTSFMAEHAARGLKVGGRQGKLFLKRWAERRLPREHLWRRKRGFYVPVRQWLRGEFLDGLAAHLPVHPVIRRWFRSDAIAELVREQQQGGNTARAIWGLMQLAIWHRIFIDGRVPGRDEDPLAWIA